MKLHDKVAIITGGSQGIGKAIATVFAKEGAKVVITARTKQVLISSVDEIKKINPDVIGIVGDVANHDDVKMVVEKTIRHFDGIDILVNNAAIQRPIGLFKDVDIEDWIDNFETNFFSVVLFCKEVLPFFIEQKKGKIINFSGGGATSSRPNFSAYGISKIAVVRFTETIAEEIKDFNIDINAIAPGAVNTKMLEEVLNSGSSAGKKEFTEAQKRAELGGTAPEIPAALALFLATEESDGISGKLISAPWDPWKDRAFRGKLRTNKDFATLRRIDEKIFFRRIE